MRRADGRAEDTAVAAARARVVAGRLAHPVARDADTVRAVSADRPGLEGDARPEGRTP